MIAKDATVYAVFGFPKVYFSLHPNYARMLQQSDSNKVAILTGSIENALNGSTRDVEQSETFDDLEKSGQDFLRRHGIEEHASGLVRVGTGFTFGKDNFQILRNWNGMDILDFCHIRTNVWKFARENKMDSVHVSLYSK